MIRKESKKGENILKAMTKGQKLLLFVAVPLVAFSILPILIVLAIGLLPTITVLITDYKNSYKLMVVGCFNLAGTFHYVFDLIYQYSINGAIAIIFSVSSLIVMLGSGGLGVALYIGFPDFFSSIYQSMARKRIKRIDAKLEKYKEEWGAGILGKSVTNTIEKNPAPSEESSRKVPAKA